MTNDVYIYGLIDPRTDEIRYVGKAVDPVRRYKRHLVEARSGAGGYKNNWIRTVLRGGKKPILEFLVSATDKNWECEERGVIVQLRAFGARLTNTETGGRGGHSVQLKTRRKMSMSQKQRCAKLRIKWGKAATPETSLKLSVNALGHCWNTGWQHTAANRKLFSRLWTPQRKLEQAERMRRRVVSTVTRLKVAESRKKSSIMYTISDADWRSEKDAQIAKRLNLKPQAVNCYRWRNKKPKTTHYEL